MVNIRNYAKMNSRLLQNLSKHSRITLEIDGSSVGWVEQRENYRIEIRIMGFGQRLYPSYEIKRSSRPET